MLLLSGIEAQAATMSALPPTDIFTHVAQKEPSPRCGVILSGNRMALMSSMTTVEIKAFVPARDFDLSKRFYQDLGFTLAWSSDDLAYFRHGVSSFLLQNFYDAGSLMMHLLVEDVDAWWQHVQNQDLTNKYGVRADPPADRPWGMRDFILVDPTSVLWRIAQNK